MTDRRDGTVGLGFEAFGTACGLAVVSGALSLLAPAFDGLTLALVALALAGWASLHRRGGSGGGRLRGSVGAYAVPFALLAAVVVVFVAAPAPLGPTRALFLALGVVPLWVVERTPAVRDRGGDRR